MTKKLKWRILLADDERALFQSLQVHARHRGIDLVTVATGEAALGLMKHETYDAVVSDLHMPGVDGIALLQGARMTQPGALRVLLTGSASVEELRGASVGDRVYDLILGKPIGGTELFDAIEKRLRGRRS